MQTIRFHNGRAVARTADTSKLRTIVLAIVAAGALLMVGKAHAASYCKGLEQALCSPTKACRWMPARVAGETKTAKGEAHKRSAKAHCRLDVTKAGEIAAKQ
ncbi:MAG: hypothetical protein K2X43_01215 [Hyphomonadaceae bacterium]|nr:hypothetical protein [Hyphomonadaceae bacterium]